MTRPNPRRSAYEILLRVERDRAFAEPLIDRELARGGLCGPDRGLLTELVYGVLRRQGSLDHLVDTFSATKSGKLERSVLLILRLGLYQLFHLDRIPVSAAVNESVNLAKEVAPRAAGLINAVLRRADREREAVVWPDPGRDPVGYLALRHSHPRWIVEGWLDQLGFAEAELLARAMAEPAPLTVRVNTLRSNRDELRALFREGGVASEPTPYSPDGLRILSRTAVTLLPGFGEGLFTVQDEASQLASRFLAPSPGDRVLDVCAAPGGKTTHLAQLMENRGEILAGDVSEKKLRRIGESVARLGATIVRTAPLDASSPAALADHGPFDRILVDAPCSGLGVLRRNPEGKWWKEPGDLARIVATQRAILDAVAPRLVPGGVILYSTCSTTLAENEGVVEDFLSRCDDFVLEDLNAFFPELAELFTVRGFFRSWPHRHGMDGFFAARLRKR
ncbi:16S rRNA (cytosine(967)-C(5))-methyltransferase RsmB [Geobacter sp.]|uniref:16S rRNA (cytosine(967)-C(5))-methyltransferase RsmB n=1 Tax=Geobacter sp. TaxID=46610 RepID=UPI002639F3DA|nr:16S rRNA (cytosine(967)-C(5))-methyltransferase RsmB [Geobacter sp.]